MNHALLTSGHDLSTPIRMITHINFDFLFWHLLSSYKLTSSFTCMTNLPPSSGSTGIAIPFYNIEDWNPMLFHFSALNHFKTWTFIMWIGVQALWIWQETQIWYLIKKHRLMDFNSFWGWFFFHLLMQKKVRKMAPKPMNGILDAWRRWSSIAVDCLQVHKPATAWPDKDLTIIFAILKNKNTCHSRWCFLR